VCEGLLRSGVDANDIAVANEVNPVLRDGMQSSQFNLFVRRNQQLVRNVVVPLANPENRATSDKIRPLARWQELKLVMVHR
jgi:phage portal protein BeeE